MIYIFKKTKALGWVCDLVHKPPKSHSSKREGDSGDSCLSTLHPEYASALEDLCLLRFKL